MSVGALISCSLSRYDSKHRKPTGIKMVQVMCWSDLVNEENDVDGLRGSGVAPILISHVANSLLLVWTC